ncbi:MAG: acyl carrier protein [Gammaproteobacteria bacterium]|nr:acyl carrier protein [Gammaproteobacteria bacterium]MDH5799257.1 acyl carrier protein [Gammaproteobacteria bacterium]
MQHILYTDLEWERQNLDSIDSDAAVAQRTKEILIDTLQLDVAPDSIQYETPLLGALAELDSMAVVSLLTTLEEHFQFVVHDEEVTAEVFETFGSLIDFVETNLQANNQ